MKNKIRYRHFYLVMTALIAAVGGFLFGYDTGIISGALIFIQQTYPMSTMTQELVVSAVVLGALVGSLSSGRLADHYGSQKMLLYMAAAFIIGTCLSTFAANISTIIIGRFVIGIAIGITSYLSPLFISEMAPAKQRGKLVLLNGMMITGGEAVAFLVDYALVPTQSWRMMFATGLIPAVLFFLGVCMLPATPRWMILKGQHEKARATLAQIRHSSQIDAEFNDILKHSHVVSSHWSALFTKLLRPVLVIGLGLGILQQFVGINTVMYYGPSIFKAVGFTTESTQILATFGMGLVNLIMSIVAILIVDKVGRRRLLLSGLALAGISLAMVGLAMSYQVQSPFMIWATFICMILYIAGYSISLGSLFWLIISEIYPLNIRGLAMSVVTSAQWAANFIVAVTFLTILNSIGSAYTFWMYAFMCVVSFIFSYYLVPETRGMSLEHIESNLRQGRPSRELGRPIDALT